MKFEMICMVIHLVPYFEAMVKTSKQNLSISKLDLDKQMICGAKFLKSLT